MSLQNNLINAGRKFVEQSMNSSKAENNLRYLQGDNKATSEYIYPNQIEDAHNIVNKFYYNNIRVISIQKKTKVGADGLMIQIAALCATHIDDNFVIKPENIRIITGMSNAGWEKDMIDKAPNCFKKNIFHHGKLTKTEIVNLQNALIIIDEIDTGDKEHQRLHTTLKDAEVLDIEHMKKNNIKFVFISATMIRELYDLYRWGEYHELYKMTIPESYIGHIDFLEMNIVKEFYPLNTIENAEKWIQDDILKNYNLDYRVHIVRVNTNCINQIQNACIRNNIKFKNHTSTDRLSDEEIKELFNEPLTRHIVLAVKGFFRRANLIPNCWKRRIGSTHELYTKKVDNNVQIQGLTGRMTGYWRNVIENGHKTGPHRTSIKAIKEYEKSYNDPFGIYSYQTTGFNKKKDKVNTKSTMLSTKNIKNLEPVDLPTLHQKGSNPINIIDITEKEKEQFNKDYILNIIRKHDENIYDKYKEYELHCWKMDTSTKCEKWNLKSMIKKDAYSSEANIKDKTKNTLMIYLYENKLIISPWSGNEYLKHLNEY